MAVLSNDGSYVTVQKNDTLWDIAEKYKGSGTQYKQLATINNIVNPDLIYIGQKIYLKKAPSSSAATSDNRVVFKQFGLRADYDNELFLTWDFKRAKDTEEYNVVWQYYTADEFWAVGSDSSTKYTYSTYSIPSGATQIRVRVKPISKEKVQQWGGQKAPLFDGAWSDWKKYYNTVPLEKTSAPTLKIDGLTLTVSLNDIDSSTATHIEFKIIKNDKTVLTNLNPVIPITRPISGHLGSVSYSCTVSAGGEYKACCRAVQGVVSKLYSDWSSYSSVETTPPLAPSQITTCKATSETSVYLEWPSVTAAKSYEIEYALKQSYFDRTDQTTTIQNIENTFRELIGLESGQEYFFRVRAVGDSTDKTSDWTSIVSVTIGKKPDIPTTWSSKTTVTIGESVKLHWTHNSLDGSDQTYAEVLAYVERPVVNDGVGTRYETIYTINETLEKPENEDEDPTTSYTIDTSSYVSLPNFKEGVRIRWKVRTAGATWSRDGFGDWSIERVIDVYAKPTLDLEVTNASSEIFEVLESFPINIKALGQPRTQTPVGYHISIIALDSYETVDNVGSVKMVSAGTEVYSEFFDITGQLDKVISAGEVDLENGYRYKIEGVVSMDSGLTADAAVEFTVSWTDVWFEPTAEISLDENSYTTYIRPYCEDRVQVNRQVIYDGWLYVVGSTTYDYLYGTALENVYTTTGEQVFQGTTDTGEEIFYCQTEQVNFTEDVLLSVYRRNYDGSFTELGRNIDNLGNTTITDPHPSLDYARYRIVAMSTETGSISYYDTSGYPVNCKSVIVQWDEEWSNFDKVSEDPFVEPPWKGSVLKLPYNNDISNSYSKDTTNVEYIGRSHPVAYYGTQLGETASWNVSIEKSDQETLYTIRRLSRWLGNVYVREPSGSGYWANISVSFSQKHCDPVIPVTIDITRVDGGA